MSNLLERYTIIEFAQLVTGSRVGMLLADMGANVIKVENPKHGDQIRYYPGQIVPGCSPAHLQLNRNKRSIAIDLKAGEGREAFWRLMSRADVFIDGATGGACARMGIGYEEHRARNPAVIYCDISGFGASGPYADIPAHSQMMNALAASYDVAVADDGDTTMRPSYLHPTQGPLGALGGEGASVSAVVGALYVCAALAQKRSADDAGCYIDVSASDAVITNAFLSMVLAANTERITDRSTVPSLDRDYGAKYSFYQAKDDRLLLFCAIESHFWRRFCHAVDRSDLLRYDNTADPIDFGSVEELRAELRALFRTRTLADWVDLARTAQVPLGPCHSTIEDLRSDPHLRSRMLFEENVHATAGSFTSLREPALVAGQPPSIRHAAPRLGEHTREVLQELGYDDQEIDRLHESGVV